MIRLAWCLAVCCLVSSPASSEPGVPRLAIRQALDVDWLKPEERSSLHRMHGVWDDQDLLDDDDRLLAAVLTGDVRNEVLLTDGVSPYPAAVWLEARGEYQGALQRLEGSPLDARGHLLQGDLLRAMGRPDEARKSYASAEPGESSATRTSAITAGRRLAEMDSARSGAYQRLMDQYAAVRVSDPLDWTRSNGRSGSPARKE